MYKKLKKWVKSAKNRPNFHHFWCDINFSDPPYRKKYESHTHKSCILGFLTKF